ncbi:MAG: hypothetical protein U0165_14500 [Polyangiaceae bacterium]
MSANGATYSGHTEAKLHACVRVGPGVAPGASLYALKIFGCTGSTQFSDAAFSGLSTQTTTVISPITSTS